MKICILMGSPRLNGNTAELCRPFIAELQNNAVETVYITLYGKNISSCRGATLVSRFRAVTDAYSMIICRRL